MQGTLYEKYPLPSKIFAILEESIKSEDVNIAVLSKLDPIIKQTQEIIEGMLKMEVPSEFIITHLDILNIFQKIAPNKPERTICVVMTLGSTNPVPTVVATLTPKKTNAIKLKNAAHNMAQ